MKFSTDARLVLLSVAAIGFGLLTACSRSDLDSARNAKASDAARPQAKVDRVATEGSSAVSAPLPGDSTPAVNQSGAGGLTQRLQAILELPKQSERKQALEDLAGALALHDPAKAAALVKHILTEKGEASSDAHAFVSGFASDYAAVDPAAAAAWAESLPLTLRFGADAFVAQQWARTDLPTATIWAEGISDLSLRTAVLRRIGQELETSGEPKVVAAWAQRLAGSVDAAQHTETISRLWAKGDVRGAFEWSAQLEDPARRTTAVVAIAATVAEQNPQVAGAWVEKFPEGELRNQAATVTSAKWSETDPEAAARWVAGMGDRQLLETSIQTVARRWLQKDRAKATQWIRSAPLSKQAKEYLLAGG